MDRDGINNAAEWERMTVLQHWDGHQKGEGQEGDQRPLGEGLSRKRETRQRVEELECTLLHEILVTR